MLHDLVVRMGITAEIWALFSFDQTLKEGLGYSSTSSFFGNSDPVETDIEIVIMFPFSIINVIIGGFISLVESSIAYDFLILYSYITTAF